MRPKTVNLTEGSITKSIIEFTIPVLLTNLLQQLYNSIDSAVLGQFCGDEALAAVGSTGALINVLIGFFLGLTTGAGILYAMYYGAGDHKSLKKLIDSSMVLSLALGAVMTVVGVVFTRGLLSIMSMPTEALDLSEEYLRIYMGGTIITLVYNVGAGLIRAEGDSMRPLIYLAIGGVGNLVMDIVAVAWLGMGVAGAALATVLSQVISALILLWILLREKEYPLVLSRLHLDGKLLKRILYIGIPAGLQFVTFDLSNTLIQSGINSFGSTVVAGSSASSNLEGFVYTAMNAFAQAAVTFTSQNMGARKYQNLNRVVLNCLLCAIVTGVVLGGGAVLAGTRLLHFYSSDAAVIAAGYERLRVICGTYLLCGIMDTLASSLRGLGYSVLPMVVSLVGSCLLRLVWIATIFQLNRTPFMLYISYPISWVLTAAVHLACLLVVRHKMKNKLKLSID